MRLQLPPTTIGWRRHGRNHCITAYVFSKEAVVVSLPIMSGETKDETRKRIKRLGDDTKVAIRNIRKQFKKGVPKDAKHEEEKAITTALFIARTAKGCLNQTMIRLVLLPSAAFWHRLEQREFPMEQQIPIELCCHGFPPL